MVIRVISTLILLSLSLSLLPAELQPGHFARVALVGPSPYVPGGVGAVETPSEADRLEQAMRIGSMALTIESQKKQLEHAEKDFQSKIRSRQVKEANILFNINFKRGLAHFSWGGLWGLLRSLNDDKATIKTTLSSTIVGGMVSLSLWWIASAFVNAYQDLKQREAQNNDQR